MTKISVEVPQHILDDLQVHIGTDRKFVNLSDAIRAALRKLLDSLDEIDKRHGRGAELPGDIKPDSSLSRLD
ncbi:MAG: ribbon-helix-helix domain-containing protein [Candidatus Hodarchaeales archaeon]|jgi:Arc/MetJ-type ribon-helix-helix transcriptional regulator